MGKRPDETDEDFAAREAAEKIEREEREADKAELAELRAEKAKGAAEKADAENAAREAERLELAELRAEKAKQVKAPPKKTVVQPADDKKPKKARVSARWFGASAYED